MPVTVLVTGGAGYVGSHTIVELMAAGYGVICLDNMSNAVFAPNAALPESLRRVQEITGKIVPFYNVDIRKKEDLQAVFDKVSIRNACADLMFAVVKQSTSQCGLSLQNICTNRSFITL